MSNRIVFNVYEENRFTGLKNLTYSTILKTNLTAAEVVDFLEVYDGFRAYVVEGIALSFVDFSCLVISSDSIIKSGMDIGCPSRNIFLGDMSSLTMPPFPA